MKAGHKKDERPKRREEKTEASFQFPKAPNPENWLACRWTVDTTKPPQIPIRGNGAFDSMEKRRHSILLLCQTVQTGRQPRRMRRMMGENRSESPIAARLASSGVALT